MHLGDATYWEPPFDGYFDLRTGMLWAEWYDSNGASGVEPPEWVKQMKEDVVAFQSASPGSDEQAALGAKLAQTMVDESAVHRHRQGAGPGLPPQRAEERARIQDLVLRVLPDLSVPGRAVVLRRSNLVGRAILGKMPPGGELWHARRQILTGVLFRRSGRGNFGKGPEWRSSFSLRWCVPVWRCSRC